MEVLRNLNSKEVSHRFRDWYYFLINWKSLVLPGKCLKVPRNNFQNLQKTSKKWRNFQRSFFLSCYDATISKFLNFLASMKLFKNLFFLQELLMMLICSFFDFTNKKRDFFWLFWNCEKILLFYKISRGSVFEILTNLQGRNNEVFWFP